MRSKAEFIQHYKRLQHVMTVFVALNMTLFFLRPGWVPFLWAVFLPAWMLILWRLRCWNCQQRLMEDGAAHIEWGGPSLLKCKMVRHKTCGAELSYSPQRVESGL